MATEADAWPYAHVQRIEHVAEAMMSNSTLVLCLCMSTSSAWLLPRVNVCCADEEEASLAVVDDVAQMLTAANVSVHVVAVRACFQSTSTRTPNPSRCPPRTPVPASQPYLAHTRLCLCTRLTAGVVVRKGRVLPGMRSCTADCGRHRR